MHRWLATTLLLVALLAPAWGQNAPPAPAQLKVGAMAPDFTLKDQYGNPVSLHDYQGKKSVVLAFYIFAFSGG
jgi:cytochrome oxidase Cu insertion factor (SCO1/SenC/PrrC family)